MALAPPPAPNFAVGDLSSGIDPGGIDRKLQGIGNVTSTWGLPKLPDSVRLDLATHEGFNDENDLNGFLNGISADISAATARQAINPAIDQQRYLAPSAPVVAQRVQQPQQQTAPPNALFRPEDDFINQVRKAAAGIAGQRAPEIITPDAVRRFKSEAIGRGILTPDTPIDDTWSPSLNTARYEMMQDEFAERLAGNRPGAVSSKNALELIGKWTSPTGLLNAAVALDFLPDVKAIKRESEQWGNKFRKWWKDKTSVRDFVDALTGPIDDIAFPVINTALLFSGVGNVVTFSRGAVLGEEIARGGFWAERLATNPIARAIPGWGNAIDVSAEAERLRQSSMLASRLSKSNIESVSKAGDALAAWRRQTGVVLAKKAVQQGMKLGFTGQLESLLLPAHVGIGIGGSGTAEERKSALSFEDWTNRQLSNPLTAGLHTWAELSLTPTSIFDEGTFTSPIKNAANRLKRELVALPAERRVGSAVVAAGLEKLRQTDPQQYALLQDELRAGRKLGATKSLDPQTQIAAKLFGVDDAERAGEVMSYIVYSAGLSSMARRDTAMALRQGALDENSTTFRRVFHGFRDKYINQLRPLDDVDLSSEHGRNVYRAYKSNVAALDEPGKDVRVARKRIWDELGGIHDDTTNSDLLTQAAEELAQHGEVRKGTLKDLLDNVTEEDIVRTIDDAWDSFGNWDKYVSSMRRVQELDFEAGGFSLSKLTALNKTRSWQPSLLSEELGGSLLPNVKIRKSFIDNMQSTVQEGRGRLTLARLDSPTAQQAELLRQQVKHIQSQVKAIDGLSAAHADEVLRTLDEFAAGKGKTISKLTNAELSEWRTSAVRSLTAPPATGLVFEQGIDSTAAKRYAEAVRYAMRNGANPQDARAFLQGKLDSIDGATDMWSNFRVASNVGGLDEKVNELARQIEFIAQDVDVPKHVADELAAQGYKVVHGTDFARPDDLFDLNGPLSAITANDMRRRSLGTFLFRDKNTMQLFDELRQSRFRNHFTSELRTLREAGHDLGSWGNSFQLGSRTEDMDALSDALRKGRQNFLEAAETAAHHDESLGWISSMGSRVRNSGLPHSLYRLRKNQLAEILGPQFSDKALDAMIASLRRAENVGFEYQGLQQIENFMVGNSWVREGLKLFSTTEAADGLRAVDRVKSGAQYMRNGKTIDAVREFKNAARQALAGGHAATASPTLLARAGGAIAGGAVGATMAAQGGGNPLEAGLGGAAFGAAFPRIINPKLAARLAGAAVAGSVAGNLSGSNLVAGAAAIGVGALGPQATSRLVREGGTFDQKGWFQYSKLGDTARYVRDRMRFSLSPFFDIQRYTEGLTLGAVADVPDGVSLPLTMRPMNRFLSDAKSRYGEAGMTRDAIVQEFKASARGWVDLDQVDSAQAWMYERGIMGFSPSEWMAAAYGQLTRQGMAKDKAIEAVRNIYTYGTKGRSGLEQSANFLFFPFSFQKKYLGDVSKFLSKDLSRTVMLHDSLKMWDTLYDEYDLENMWKDHLPVLRNLRKVNALAFGISPGEFGGINRPFYEIGKRLPGVGDAHDAILNAFLPQAVQIHTQHDWDGLRPHVQRLLPVWRDAEQMAEDLKQQGHVLFSPSHVTEAKESDLGWDEYSKMTSDVHKVAKEAGTSYSAIMNSNNEQWAPLREMILAKRSAIEKKYPAFVKSREQASERAIQKKQDVAEIVREPQSNAEVLMGKFQHDVDRLEMYLGQQGLSLKEGLQTLDEDWFSMFRNKAIALARQDPEFASLYRRYYQSMFGPIHAEVK